MDAWTLDLAEGLRPWANAGLRTVLCDCDVATLKVSRETSAPGHQQPVPRQSPPPRPKPSGSTPSAREKQQGAAPPRKWTPPETPSENPAPSPEEEARKQAEQPGVTPTEAAADLAVFPWEEFRPRLVVPCRVVWTYWELGQDFSGNPLDERRDLFRTIIQHLKWPGRSLSFWPHNFVHKDKLVAQPGQFWRGVREARAGHVVVFGQQGFKTLFPRETFSYGSFTHNDLTITVLPGPGRMLDGDKDAKRQVWTTLKSLRF